MTFSDKRIQLRVSLWLHQRLSSTVLPPKSQLEEEQENHTLTVAYFQTIPCLTMLIHQAKLPTRQQWCFNAFVYSATHVWSSWSLCFDRPGPSSGTHGDRQRQIWWKGQLEAERERREGANLKLYLEGSNQTRASILLSNKIYHSVISHFYSNGSPQDDTPGQKLQLERTVPDKTP